MLAAGYLRGNEAAEGWVAAPLGIVRYDRAEGVGGDNEHEGVLRLPERRLHLRGVEQAERDVQCFAEVSVIVIVDVARVHDDTDPELAVLPGMLLEARVVADQKLAEVRYKGVEQQRLVCRVDQREQAITTVGEPATAARADSC